MEDFLKAVELLDTSEVLDRLFFPRREVPGETRLAGGEALSVKVDEAVFVGCRFYPAAGGGPVVLYFHGNGEIAADYDYVAPLFRNRGINLFVADYRGYGTSGGSPGCAALIADCHPVFEGFVSHVRDRGCTGDLFVMGRSLGSAAAIEVAYRYQERIKGLIVESGFASSANLLDRLGAAHLFENPERILGFGNDIKISRIGIPTLIIHGQWDDLIPAEEGRRLLDLSGASQKKGLFIEGAGHNDLLDVGLDEYMAEIASFCGAPT